MYIVALVSQLSCGSLCDGALPIVGKIVRLRLRDLCGPLRLPVMTHLLSFTFIAF